MELKEKIDAVIDKVKTDKEFAEKFSRDPVMAVRSLIGIDLPNDQINMVVEGVKANVSRYRENELVGSVKSRF